MLPQLRLNQPVSLRKLAETIRNNSANEVLLGSDYHISKRSLRDLLPLLIQENLRDDDEVVLTESFQNGAVYLGNICRIFHENYIPIWYYIRTHSNAWSR